MNTDDLDRLDAATIDELISADIDGELDLAIEELVPSYDSARVRQWLATSQVALARRAVLVTTITAIAPATPAVLTELERRRILRAVTTSPSSRAATQTRRFTAIAGVASAAAIAALVVGISVTHSRSGEQSASKQNSSTTTSGNELPKASATQDVALRDVGALRNVDDLRAAATPPAALTTSTTAAQAPGRMGTEAFATGGGDQHCLVSLPGAGPFGALTNIAVGRYQEQPVVIASGISKAGRVRLWAYRADDCAVVLTAQIG